MNTEPEKVIEYSNLKENLAQEFFNDRKSCTKSNEDYIQNIIERHC